MNKKRRKRKDYLHQFYIDPLLYTLIRADKNILFEILKLVSKINIKKSFVTYVFVCEPIGSDRVQRLRKKKPRTRSYTKRCSPMHYPKYI